jgi:hypothetical protein
MLMKISLFGWLDRIPFWRDLSYTLKGSLLRGLKAGAAVTVGIILAAATQGLIFPATMSPITVLVVTTVLQAVDKYLRESNASDDLKEVPLTDAIPDDTPDVPPTDG